MMHYLCDYYRITGGVVTITTIRVREHNYARFFFYMKSILQRNKISTVHSDNIIRRGTYTISRVHSLPI